MSLINQMLEDLKKQQEEEGRIYVREPEKKTWRDRIPFVPLPLLAGIGFGVVLLVCWWLAGALSSWMYSYDDLPAPVVKTVDPELEKQRISEEEYRTLLAEAQPVVPTAEPPVATEHDRQDASPASVAEPPQAIVKPASPAPAVVTKTEPAKVEPTKAPAAPVTVARKPEPVAVKSTPKPVVAKQAVPSTRQPAVRTSRIPPPTKPLRLHPDQLPGAVVAGQQPIAPATPYGAAETAFLKGQRAYRDNRNAAAIESLEQALELYPGHLVARELLVDILEMDGQAGEAMALLSQGLEIAPDYMPFKKRQARLLVDQGDLRAAVQVMLTGGLPTVEEDPEAHVLLASLYLRLDEAFLAAQTYRNLLVAWPQTGAFWVGLGTALEAQQLPGEAAKAYRQALQIKDLRRDLHDYATQRLASL